MKRLSSIVVALVVPIALGLGACLTEPAEETAMAALALHEETGCTHALAPAEGEAAWALGKQIGRQELIGGGGVQSCGSSACHGQDRVGGALQLTSGTSNRSCADQAGCHGTQPGRSRRAVVLGSHLDSVPDGGWLDGALGVLAGLEILRRVAAGARPDATLALVDWADEEGARFGRSLLGSGLAAGLVEAGELAQLRDRDGVLLADALAEHGVDLGRAAGAARERLAEADAYVELHIEQGPVLEREGIPLGVVTGTAGVERHRVRVTGQAVQGGAFPMALRRDPLMAAARLALEVRRVAAHDERGRGTVGDVRAWPGIATAVPAMCELLVDQRHPDAPALAAMLGEVRAAGERIATEERVGVQWQPVWRIDPVPFEPALVALAEQTLDEVAGRCIRMFSGALHDAASVAQARVPTVMLFVRSRRGLSHTREEDTAPEDLELAVRALDVLAGRLLARVAA
jgi:N-carbamoyl-L-amino-acid hydrolase